MKGFIVFILLDVITGHFLAWHKGSNLSKSSRARGSPAQAQPENPRISKGMGEHLQLWVNLMPTSLTGASLPQSSVEGLDLGIIVRTTLH